MKQDRLVAWTLFSVEFFVLGAAVLPTDKVIPFLDSAFFTTIFGAGAAAFAGAYGAQRIVERGKLKDDLSKEIRNTNAAIVLTFGICNTLIIFKKQFAKPMKEKFDRDRKQALLALETQTRFNFETDFRTLQRISLSIEPLQKIVIENIAIIGRPLSALTTVAQVVDTLNNTIAERNDLIDAFRSGKIAVKDRAARYFGFADGGHMDEQFANTVEACYVYSEDGIFYSRSLLDDLVSHGRKLAAEYLKQFGVASPIHAPDFTIAAREGLLPNDADYASWHAAFRSSSEAAGARV